MKPEYQLALAGLGGFTLGALLMAKAARRQERQQLAAEQLIESIPTPAPVFTNVSSTGSLNNGWTYFVTIVTPGSNPADTAAATAAAKAVGFVNPGDQGDPQWKVNGTAATALTVFTGTTGTSLPASTPTLQWSAVYGSPAPAVLSV